ncbi:MAG: YfhO family protein, partial [Acidobacteriota bacterium]
TDSPRLLDPVATPRQIPGFDLEASKDHRESSGSLRGLERTISTDQDVLLLSRTSNRLEFEIHSDEPSHLFLSVTHYPGWSAEVNGAPVRLQRAAFFMTALPVPAGSSHVVLRIAPGSVKMGLALTVLGLFLTAWSAGWLAAEPSSKPPVTRAGI